MPEGRKRYRFPPAARVRSRRDFDRVFQQRNRASDRLVTVYLARREGEQTRLGIAVSRRFGNAVCRNRIKRLIREAFRTVADQLPRGVDLVVIPRSNAAPTLPELQGSLLDLARRLDRPAQSGRAAKPARSQTERGTWSDSGGDQREGAQ